MCNNREDGNRGKGYNIRGSRLLQKKTKAVNFLHNDNTNNTTTIVGITVTVGGKDGENTSTT